MTVNARTPQNAAERDGSTCTGCGGAKEAPIATIVNIGHIARHDVGTTDVNVTLILCEECGRDAANAIGFMCVREDGWSKIEPRRRKAEPNRPTDQKTRKKLQRSAR